MLISINLVSRGGCIAYSLYKLVYPTRLPINYYLCASILEMYILEILISENRFSLEIENSYFDMALMGHRRKASLNYSCFLKLLGIRP